jgi:hypothetical protein
MYTNLLRGIKIVALCVFAFEPCVAIDTIFHAFNMRYSCSK